MMDLAIIGLKEQKVPGDGNIESCSPVSPPLKGTPSVGADGIDSPSASDHQAEILRKAAYKQAQHRRRSQMLSQNSARVHDFELCLSHGNRRFNKKSPTKRQASKKHKGHHFSAAKFRLIDMFRDVQPVEEEDGDSEGHDEISNIKTFQRLVQRSGLEEEVLLLQKHLEELELRSVLESAVGHVSGTLTSFPRHLPIAIQELLADIAVLEAAVLKLEEKSTALQRQLGQERIEREIAELCIGTACPTRGEGSPIPPISSQKKIHSPDSQPDQTCDILVTPPSVEEGQMLPDSLEGLQSSRCGHEPDSHSPWHLWKENQSRSRHQDLWLTIPDAVEDQLPLSTWQNLQHLSRLIEEQGQSPQQCKNLGKDEDQISLNGDNVQFMFPFHDQHLTKPTNSRQCLTSAVTATCEDPLSGLLPAFNAEKALHSPLSPSSSQEQEKCTLLGTPGCTSMQSLKSDVKDVTSKLLSLNQMESCRFSSEDDHIAGSGFTLNSSNYKQQPYSQQAEALSVDETVSGQQLSLLPSARCKTTEGEDGWELTDFADTPNQLSEQMLCCMISIFCHLADSNAALKGSSPSGSIHSPTSHFGHQASSSLSSLSESSLLSFARSPLLDHRNKEEVMGTDATPDPFKVQDKVPWMDIGAYGNVFEVPWLSVGKDQLEYAAKALEGFKLLVEQLANIDPSHLSHDEKLAFWINLYNTLMMHGYLAYGIPRSDLKFLSLLQKAAYTVGGHSFSAATIECCLLRSKSTATRPQIMLLMPLHKNKLTEMQMKFGIDQPEPLINFALCCGTRSALMVRIYTAEKVHLQLEDAFHDFARASVGISTKGKLLVPKLLQCHARDIVEESALIDWICNLLPSSQVAVICKCIQQQHHRILGSRKYTIVPFDFTFRYLFPADIAKKFIS